MNRKLILLAITLWVLFIIFFSYLTCEKIANNESTEKVDSLKIDSIYVIRDSIIEKIDTVHIKLENNTKQYEKNFNRVVNNDANEDYVFFLEYINANKERLDSISKNLGSEIR